MDIRVNRASNGTPVFVASGNNQAFKRVFGATWDPARALWMYPAFYPASTKVLADLDALAREITVVWSDTALQHRAALLAVSDDLTQRKLPAGFTFVTPPYAHQIDGLCHVFYNLRAALFYDPGLGKTKIAIDLMRLLHHLGNRNQTLVLGPRVTIQNWGREIDLHSGRQLTWAAITGTLAQKKDAIARIAEQGADVVLATYDTARSLVDLIMDKLPYRTLINDECHLVKSFDSARTKATWEIAQHAARRLNMTGSPTQGNPLDLYGQFKILGDAFMPEALFEYKRKFLITAGPRSHLVMGYKNLDILNARTVFLSTRRTKEECLDLPARTTVDVSYVLTPMQSAIHNQLVNEMKLDPGLLADQLGLDPVRRARMPPMARMPHRAATLSKLLQVATGFIIKNESDPSFCDAVEEGGCRHLEYCVERRIRPRTPACVIDPTPLPNVITTFDESPKLDAIDDLLDSIFEKPNAKVIVWAVFKHELALLEVRLQQRTQIKYVKVDGDTDDIQKAIDDFNNDPDVRVYLAQVSTGVGITLNAASYMIYSSLPYSLNTYLQALDRNYRIGQTSNVTVYRLVGQGTPEPAVAILLDNKVDVDALLTQKIDCVICPESLRCFANGVEPFDETCIHPRKVTRPAIRAHALPMLPEE